MIYECARDGSELTTKDATDPSYWNPVWLRRRSLMLVTIFSISLAAGILVLLLISHRYHGLRLFVSSHYTWTYGPTALFILYTALWRQIDFHCKTLTSWSVLQKKEEEAAQNILLDYISPIEFSGFRTAISNKHWAVVTAAVGFTTVRLLAVASTSLFRSRSVSLPGAAISTTQSTFRAGINNDLSTTPGLFEPGIVYEAYAVSSRGLPYMEGVTQELIYETIDFPPETEGQNFTLIGTVQAILPKYECQSAPFDLNFTPTNSTELHPEVQIKLAFPECTLRANGEGASVFALNPQTSLTPPRQLSPLVQRIDCLNQNSSLADNFQLLTLVDFRYNQTLDKDDSSDEHGESIQATSWSTNAGQVVGIACKSSYSLEDVSVTYRSSDGQRPGNISVKRVSSVEKRKLGNLTDSDIGDVSTAALSAAAFMFGSLLTNTFAEEYPNTLFKMMASLSDGTYASLLDEAVMIDTAQTALEQIALQSLHRHLVSDVKRPVEVEISVDETRLFVNTIIASVMSFGSLVLALCTGILLFIRPHNVTRQDPELLATAAVRLKHSPALQRMLKQASAQQAKLKTTFSGTRFHQSASGIPVSGINVNGQLATTFMGLEPPETDESVPEETRWFRESTARKPFVVLSLCLPFAIIGALEALQQVSDKHNGIATVARPSNQILSLLPNVLSAAVMLGVATMFNGLEFNIAILAPLKYLRGRIGGPRGDLLTSYLGRTPPMVLFIAFIRQHWAIMLSTSAALVGSVLTIVVSGLYIFETQASQSSVSLNRLDAFNISWSVSAFNDSAAAVVSSLTESVGLADPASTYQELAFPRIEMQTVEVTRSSETKLLVAQLPAMRASLDCVALDPSTFNFTASSNPRLGSSQASFSARMPLPDDCQLGGPGGNKSSLEFQASFNMQSNTSYVGKLFDVHVGPYDNVLAAAFDELAPYTQPDNPPQCPSLAFIYGYADIHDQSHTTASALVCTQRLNQLTTNVTFTPGNMSISLLHPPVADESTASPIPNTSKNTINNITYVPYRIQQHFDKTFVSNNQFRSPGRKCSFWDAMPSDALDGSAPAIDPFWQGVLCSDKPYLPIDDLSKGVADKDAVAEVFTAVQRMYRRYMAQAISANMRVPFTQLSTDQSSGESDNGSAGLTATLLDAEPIVRLVQNKTLNIALQLMLGVMSVLMALAVWICQIWEPVAQYNPCSIAGKMVLFAGSQMCDSSGQSEVAREVFPDGAEGMNEEELRSLWREKGWEFRLGWWDDERGGRRWGVDAVRAGSGSEGKGV